MPDYSEYIASALVSNGVSATARQINQLSDYLSELLRVNEYMNLTAIREPFEAAVKNIADCAVCTKYIPDNTSLLDVGSGAGLPAFPFAIMRPDIRVTALDSTGKKVNFISETVKKTGLDNLTAICGRAEELAANSQYREKFGAVSARAVARLNILSELCLPFIKKGGAFLAMKEPSCRNRALRGAPRGFCSRGKCEERRAFFSCRSFRGNRTYGYSCGKDLAHAKAVSENVCQNFRKAVIELLSYRRSTFSVVFEIPNTEITG